MKRALSYKKPSRLIIDQETSNRQDDERRGTQWTRSEVAWLKKHYEDFTAEECGEFLRRSELAVRIKVHRLRLEQDMGRFPKEAA